MFASELKDNEANENKNESAKRIQKVFRGSKVRKNVVRDIIPPAELSILNESDEKVNDDESKKNDNENHAQNKTPEKADKDKSAVSAHTEAPKKTKPHTPVLIATQRKSLHSSFTEVSEDKDEDFEELEQTPKKSIQQIKEEWLKKFDDADVARRKLIRTMEYANELETEIE